MRRRGFGMIAVAAALLFFLPLQAAGGEQSAVKDVLTIASEQGEVLRNFTLEELEDLGLASVATHTPWHSGQVTFEGPLLLRVLEKAGVADVNEIRVTALNDYQAVIPTSDIRKWNVLLATRLNGKPLSIRHQGPLFIIYPFDNELALRNEIYYSRSVWQTRTIHVRR